ncbi:MAG: hypothetical protein M3N19_02605 [Candidatus Eremiobacteraeota bacterium]|nr:hypothetical protein [Candidatus Eremiobacteraeota bacterium]
MDRTVELFVRRWRFYCVLSLAAIAVQGAICLVWRRDIALDVVTSAVLPIITTVANIQTALDLRGGELDPREIFAWALRRLWAVMLIDFVVSFTYIVGFVLMVHASSIDDAVMGLLTLLLTSTLVFADVFASVELFPSSLLRIPFAFMRSVALFWQHGNMVRALAILSFQVAAGLLALMLSDWLTFKHAGSAAFVADVPLGTLFAAPFAILTTVVYFDAIAREDEATS